MAGSKIKSWEVSDKFWERVRPLIPKPKRDETKTYQRRKGAGRKPMDSRKVFCAIMFVLRTGIQWKALPKEFGSSSSVHAYFRKWVEAGFFLKLWRISLHPQEMVAMEETEEPCSQSLFGKVREPKPREMHPLMGVKRQEQFQSPNIFPTYHTQEDLPWCLAHSKHSPHVCRMNEQMTE